MGVFGRLATASSLVFILSGCALNNIPSPVREGMLFRTRQLTPVRLENVIEEYGIRSIVNLRGMAPGESWYEDERHVAEKHNVTLVSYRLSASKWAPPEILKEVVQSIETLPKPLLIHCQGGADRTGLVSSLVIASDGGPINHVLRHLSIRYGHVKWWQGTHAMDDLLKLYLQDRKEKEISLSEWVDTRYPAHYAERQRTTQ